MTQRLFVLLPAAGRATRFAGSGDLPKQYQSLVGRTVLEWSLQTMRRLRPSRIVLAVAADDLRWQSLPAASLTDVQVVSGGTDRARSVLHALAAIADVADADDWALVHDVARPCVTIEDCARLHEAVQHHPVGGVLAVPVADTVKRTAVTGEPSVVLAEATIDRSALWLAQTPQQFRYAALLAALTAAVAAGAVVTDEASAMEHAGHRPLLVRGNPDNIKITWPEDLARAAAVIGRQLRASRQVLA